MSGGVLEWTDEMTTIKLDTHGSEPRLITIAMSCVVGAEEIAAQATYQRLGMRRQAVVRSLVGSWSRSLFSRAAAYGRGADDICRDSALGDPESDQRAL